MKKKLIIALLLVMAMFSAVIPVSATTPDTAQAAVKNIILLIPDGMPVDTLAIARWYTGGELLAMDTILTGMVRTHSADAPVADSAPAGTAMATGFKSHTGYIGVLPEANTMPGLEPIAEGDALRPVANITEAARLAGKSTGIISTSELMHATPADFSAHDPSRKNYDALSEQQIFSNINVFLGAGSMFFSPDGRSDGDDLMPLMRERYQVVTTAEELNAVTTGNVFGLFAEGALAYDFDRDPVKEPSLAEMTGKAIELLNQNENGFFLMVEGSKIDWASHANDPVGQISDTLAFDAAVKVALDFAKEDGNTIVLGASDHGNSGLTIGDISTSGNYDKLPLEAFFPAALMNASKTGEGLEALFNEDRSNVKEVMSEYYGLENLSDAEIEEIQNTEEGSMNYTVGKMMAERANFGYTTNGHTGGDVQLYCYAPEGVELLSGLVDNTDFAKYMAKMFGLDLEATTERLFVRADEAFEAKGATVEMDETDAANLTFVVKKGEQELRLVQNRNLALLNGETVELEGCVIYSGEQLYVPQQAIDLIAD